ncbi:MAG TPA: GNAT family N-acetyltransferase [Candidatus Binataceae bacterium]|nr:GNAT family N-acetyltransferase [Candidatus Binataceae bacterium]
MGDAAGPLIASIGQPALCWIAAWLGDTLAGAIGFETIVDAGAVCALGVAPAMRRSGIGAALVDAVRKAARTRGVRRLYAIAPRGNPFLQRFGYQPVNRAALTNDLAGSFVGDYLRSNRQELERFETCCVDISGDGLIER